MQALQQKLLDYIGGTMSDPSAGTGAIKTAALDRINAGYSGAPQRVATNLAKFGMGSSGKLGTGMVNLERSRLGDISDLEGQMAQYVLNRQDNAASLGSRLLGQGSGTTTTGYGSGNGLSNGLMSAGNGLENLATLTMLSKLLKGGSSGSTTTWNPFWR